MKELLTNYRFWIVVLAIFVLASLAKPKTDTVTPNKSTPVVQATPTDSQLPETFRQAYLEGCSPDGTNMGYCECTINYLDTHYTTDEVVKMSQEYANSGVIPPAMSQSIKVCLGLFD